MSDTTTKPSVPDLVSGVPLSKVPDGGMLVGQAHGESVLLVRRADDLFAVGAFCSHYGAPLGDGLVVDDTVRCPWHHACFNLRTGEALRAPALDPIPCWRVEQRDGVAYVRDKLERAAPRPLPVAAGTPGSVVIVGGGAAGSAAAEMLRREGYAGRITMLSADPFGPCDRPNLSKGYLAGTAPAESNPLRSSEFYDEHRIDLKLNARVAAIDTAGRQVRLVDGTRHAYDALLLATGAEPVRLAVPGSDLPHVHYLRTLSDGHALVAKVLASERAVVIGAGFIGLEVTASLRARGIAVQVVAPGTIPMERILGTEVAQFIRRLHEQHGVTFQLGTTAASIDERGVTLQTGEHLPADLVVVGIGVRPALSLAEDAGLAIDRGITVDEYLETSIPGIFAAGDIARWPDRLTGEHIRVEHWVVAERQGQTAARNMLGRRERFDAVPFFWTEQYDFSLAYVGHAEHWDEAELEGSLDADTRDCTITYRRGDTTLAVALVHRDLEGLRAEVEFEARTEVNSLGGDMIARTTNTASRMLRLTKPGVAAVAVVALTAVIGLAGCRMGEADAQRTPGTSAQAAAQQGYDAEIQANANRMLEDGKRIFRFDTFGSEDFWGGRLRLHEALAGERLGGVGAGVSPKTALALGLKVDAEALPAALVAQIQAGTVDLDDPATTAALLKLNAVVGVTGFFDPDGKLRSVGIQCALCHSTVDDSFSPGIGKRLDGWGNRDLNVGAIVATAPNLQPFSDLLGVDVATVRKVLNSWGPGRYDAELNMDGKAMAPDGKSAATMMPSAFGLAGVNQHTWTGGWGTVTYWNAYVANTQMYGKGTFLDSRLDDAAQYPVAAKAGWGRKRDNPDLITAKLPALHFYQLAMPTPKAPAGSFNADAARRGQVLFAGSARCASCHVPPIFTEPGYNLHKGEEIGIGDFQANRGPERRYVTTPLRALFDTLKLHKGGFYHDGRFATLVDVVEHYDGFFKLRLSAQQKNDLIEYLKSI